MPSKLPGDKEIMRLKMLCKVIPTKSQLLTMDVMFLGGSSVLLAAQLILVMILKHPSQKGIWF